MLFRTGGDGGGTRGGVFVPVCVSVGGIVASGMVVVVAVAVERTDYSTLLSLTATAVYRVRVEHY